MAHKYKIGDRVFVVDWGKHYSEITKWEDGKKVNILPFKTEIPQYSDISHHWNHIYEPNLTLKGTINKREPNKLVERIPVYKNYKYEVVEIIKHPKAGEYFYNEEQRERWNIHTKYTENDILLLASTHIENNLLKCFIVIEEEGVSFLTSEQFADEKFNALKESHRGKWKVNMGTNYYKGFPDSLKGIIYDTNDNVLFGSNVVKGKVMYFYIPGEYMETGRPYYYCTSISYDGKGNSDLPEGAVLMPHKNLKNMFVDNTNKG